MEREADFGPNSEEPLAHYDPATSSWKTSQRSLDGELIEYAETWPSSFIVWKGKLFRQPTLLCLTVENESALLPTPTKSFGVNARGWGLSRSGRKRYSQQTQDNALRFGYRPPIALLEWMMGFPEGHTDVELRPSETQLSPLPSNGQVSESLSITNGTLWKATKTGLTLDESVTFEQWEAIGRQLFEIEASWQWWVGDWLNHGDSKYGETYKTAIEVTGKAYSSLANAKCVAAEFESSRRRENLSWGHHLELLGVDKKQQKKLLDKAEADGLSVMELRREVKGQPAKPGSLEKLRRLFDAMTEEERAEAVESWQEWMSTETQHEE